MADVSLWSSEVPANTSVISQFDDLYRSDKSIERNVWEEEHYWDTGSGDSAGEHRQGSFRPYHGLESQVSQVGDEGRFMFTSDTSHLFDVSHGSTPLLMSRFEPVLLHPNQSTHTDHGFVLMHKWQPQGVGWAASRMITNAADIGTVSSFNTTRAHTDENDKDSISWWLDPNNDLRVTGVFYDFDLDPATNNEAISNFSTVYRMSFFTAPLSQIT
jgi:hypothetical protein